MTTLRQGDTGTVLELVITDEAGDPVDLSSADVELRLLRPGQRVGEPRTPALGSDGTDGAVSYTTTAEDLTTPGIWWLIAEVTLPNGRWYSTRARFDVDPVF